MRSAAFRFSLSQHFGDRLAKSYDIYACNGNMIVWMENTRLEGAQLLEFLQKRPIPVMGRGFLALGRAEVVEQCAPTHDSLLVWTPAVPSINEFYAPQTLLEALAFGEKPPTDEYDILFAFADKKALSQIPRLRGRRWQAKASTIWEGAYLPLEQPDGSVVRCHVVRVRR